MLDPANQLTSVVADHQAIITSVPRFSWIQSLVGFLSLLDASFTPSAPESEVERRVCWWLAHPLCWDLPGGVQQRQ